MFNSASGTTRTETVGGSVRCHSRKASRIWSEGISLLTTPQRWSFASDRTSYNRNRAKFISSSSTDAPSRPLSISHGIAVTCLTLWYWGPRHLFIYVCTFPLFHRHRDRLSKAQIQHVSHSGMAHSNLWHLSTRFDLASPSERHLGH
jgi:hypothetical protein